MDRGSVPNQASEQSAPKPKRSIEEIFELRDAFMEGARRKVDPNGTGFDAQNSFAGGWGWDWGERIYKYLVAASIRVEFAIIAGGGAIAAGHMYGTPSGERYATITLAVSALFAVWVAISAIIAQARS
jgi:hypothetical protein